MAGYRCVNYHELCRLCTNSSGTKVNIYSEEGKKLKLFDKITECLPVMMSESDKLPKIVCSSCIQHVETITEFRQTCINAQNMLESCLNTPKLRNGGKVYIKDVTKKIPASTTITKTVVGPTSNVGTSTQGSDFLSSIIQAVGIQNVEDVEIQPPPLQPQQQTPQYTFTFDGQTIKANQIQYKIEEPPTITLSDIQESKPSQQSLVQSVNEFLKLNTKSTIVKEQPKNNIKINTSQINIKKITKPAEKPQIQQQQQHQQQQTPNFNIVLASPNQTKITTSPKLATQQPQQHHIVLPIQFKEESPMVTTTTQLDQKNFVLPTTYLQMKLPPQFRTVDGQQVVHLTPANIQLQQVQSVCQPQTSSPQQITYTTSRNSFSTNTTNITPSFRITTNSQGQQTVAAQPQISTVTIPASGLQLSTIPGHTTPIKTMPTGTIQFQTIKPETPPTPTTPQVTIKRHIPAVTSTPKLKKLTTVQQQTTPANSVATLNKQENPKAIIIKSESVMPPLTQARSQIVTLTSPTLVTSSTAIKIQQSSPTTYSTAKIINTPTKTECPSPTSSSTTTTTTSINNNNNYNSSNNNNGTVPNPVACDTCGKLFKRKEHLFQHMKLHTGLRPFKCNETGCNKAFSRKEHLMRHLVSHTGKKLFSCDLCQKLFSRKDNLNKHKRIHPEYLQVVSNKTKMPSLTTSTAAAVALAGTSSTIITKQEDSSSSSSPPPIITTTMVSPKLEIITPATTATISSNSATVALSESAKASAAAVATGKSLTEKILADGRISNYVCDVCDKVFAVKQYYMDHRRSHDSEANGVRELGGGRKPKRAKVATKKQQQQQQQQQQQTNATQTITSNDESQMTVTTTMALEDAQQQIQQQPQVVQFHLTTPTSMHSSGTNTKTHDTTVLTLPSSIASIVSLNPGSFITNDMMGNYKIDL